LKLPAPRYEGILPHHGAGHLPCKEKGWLCQRKKSFLSEAAVYLLKFGSVRLLA
jgi:hypothetical protein